MVVNNSFLQSLIMFRRELHQYPELSGEEYETAKTIMKRLHLLEPDELITNLGGTGLLATFHGKDPGPHLMFRAELDALPIQEENDFSYQSQIDGVAHKCGHDGHMTVLIGLAQVLSEQRPPRGSVSLLFQPAEETGAGADAVIKDPKFEKMQPDLVFAFHNLPGYPLGHLLARKGNITAAVRSMIIRLHGKTAHAAEPEHGYSPAPAIAEILQKLEPLSNNDPSRKDFKVITPVHINMGEKAYGVAAGYGEVHLTIRSWNESIMKKMVQSIKKIITNATKDRGLSYEIDWTDSFLANKNDTKALKQVLAVAKENGVPVTIPDRPMKFGEDFGYFTQKFPGAFFCLGSGEDSPALHNPDYDFPDELIEVGVGMFHGIVELNLGE